MNFKKNLSGIHYSLELKKILEDPKEFLATLKSELLEDEIYIFTPKGDIKVLPKGATAIDFAYSIHDEVGNHIIGCKINSIDMPLVSKLQNGNIVEIITSELKTVPEEEWIEVIKTAKAKNQILKLLQTKKEEEKKSIKIETFTASKMIDKSLVAYNNNRSDGRDDDYHSGQLPVLFGYHSRLPFYQKPSGNYSLLTVPSFYKKGQALSTDFVNLDTILT